MGLMSMLGMDTVIVVIMWVDGDILFVHICSLDDHGHIRILQLLVLLIPNNVDK